MKKIKFKKRINEDENQQGRQTAGPAEIVYEEPDANVLKAVKDTVKTDAMRQAMKAAVLFEVKLTKPFFESIQFPTAPQMLRSLMQVTNMPRKYTDIHNSIDADPVRTISEAEDVAIKYFSGGKVSDKEVKQKQLDLKAVDKDGKDIPKPAPAPVKDTEKNNTNQQAQQADKADEAVSYNTGYQFLNEDMAAAAGAGYKTGSLLTTIFGHAAAFLSGAATGFAPIIVGAKAIGALGPSISSDHGNFPTDGRDILQDDDLRTDAVSKISTQTDLPEKIDSYLGTLMNSIQQPLVYCTPKAASNDIADLFSILAGLKAQTDESILGFIKSNDAYFKMAKERERDDKINRINSQNEVLNDINKLLTAAAKKGIKVDPTTLKQLSSPSEAGFTKR